MPLKMEEEIRSLPFLMRVFCFQCSMYIFLFLVSSLISKHSCITNVVEKILFFNKSNFSYFFMFFGLAALHLILIKKGVDFIFFQQKNKLTKPI
jgi:hypothetical protein